MYDHATKILAREINDQLLAESARLGRRGNMCTTLDILLLTADRFYIAHAGDSVVWQVAGDRTNKLTTEHKADPQSNAVTNILGRTPAVKVDPVSGELWPGMTFVLTSDGVHGRMQPDAIGRYVRAVPAQKGATRLIEAALNIDGSDNATAAVVQILAADEASGSFRRANVTSCPAKVAAVQTGW